MSTVGFAGPNAGGPDEPGRTSSIGTGLGWWLLDGPLQPGPATAPRFSRAAKLALNHVRLHLLSMK